MVGFKHSVRLLANANVEMLAETLGDRTEDRGVNIFSSVNKCLNIMQAKKDDLESLLYILLFLIRRGRLSDRLIEKEGRFKSVIEINRWKATTSPDIICEKAPKCYSIYLSYIRSLGSQERPNYSFLRSLFSKNLSEKKLSENLGQLIAYDIVKILAQQKSHTASEVNSAYKATLGSEKNMQNDDCEEEIQKYQNSQFKKLQTRTMSDHNWNNSESDLDEMDSEAYHTESLSFKMAQLNHYDLHMHNPLSSLNKISTYQTSGQKESLNTDMKLSKKWNEKEIESREYTDLAETRRYEDKESLDEFLGRSRSVHFMVRHAKPK